MKWLATIAHCFSKRVADYKAQKPTPPPAPEAIWQDPKYFFGFGLGIGAIPFAPGTFATALAIPFYLALSALPVSWYVLFVLAFCAFSSWISEKLSREMAFHDHPGMCIDEFCGFFVTMIAVPPTFTHILFGFILFRLFDIAKPGPIRWCDRHIHGGIGMILDDVLAGALAALCLHLGMRLL